METRRVTRARRVSQITPNSRVTVDSTSEDRCPICHEDLEVMDDSVWTLPCTHKAHGRCLIAWWSIEIQRNATALCLVCRCTVHRVDSVRFDFNPLWLRNRTQVRDGNAIIGHGLEVLRNQIRPMPGIRAQDNPDGDRCIQMVIGLAIFLAFQWGAPAYLKNIVEDVFLRLLDFQSWVFKLAAFWMIVRFLDVLGVLPLDR
jgi:RING finger family protein